MRTTKRIGLSAATVVLAVGLGSPAVATDVAADSSSGAAAGASDPAGLVDLPLLTAAESAAPWTSPTPVAGRGVEDEAVGGPPSAPAADPEDVAGPRDDGTTPGGEDAPIDGSGDEKDPEPEVTDPPATGSDAHPPLPPTLEISFGGRDAHDASPVRDVEVDGTGTPGAAGSPDPTRDGSGTGDEEDPAARRVDPDAVREGGAPSARTGNAAHPSPAARPGSSRPASAHTVPRDEAHPTAPPAHRVPAAPDRASAPASPRALVTVAPRPADPPAPEVATTPPAPAASTAGTVPAPRSTDLAGDPAAEPRAAALGQGDPEAVAASPRAVSATREPAPPLLHVAGIAAALTAVGVILTGHLPSAAVATTRAHGPATARAAHRARRRAR